MKIEDCQYLATPHKFKGLRVYTCEPQGLRNASEHSYERLGLVYGDLCGEEKMTRMADGLYILADTLEELEENFIEVLSRAELCGFTFKPSKVIIAPLKTVIFGWQKDKKRLFRCGKILSVAKKSSPILFTSKHELFNLGQNFLSRTILILSWPKNILSGQMDRA